MNRANIMSYELIIFDCDGVMFDSRAANIAFYNHIRSRFNLPDMSPEQVDYVHRATAEESVNYIIPDEDGMREAAQKYRLGIDYSPFNDMMVIEPHLVELLEFLGKNHKTAVCTNRSNTIMALLDQFGLTSYFDVIVSALDVTRPKPDPEMVEKVLSSLEVPAEKALFVGDSISDAQAARSAGVRLVAFGNKALAADYHIDALDRMKDILSGS